MNAARIAASFPARAAAGLLAAAAVVAGMAVFNDVNIRMRLSELNMFLRSSVRGENTSDHMLLLTKLRLQKDLYDRTLASDSADLQELRIITLFAQNASGSGLKNGPYGAIVPVMEPALNGIRFVLGKPPVSVTDDETRNRFLDAAYYFERCSSWSKAAELFAKAENVPSTDRGVRAGIILHKGFCLASTGNIAGAAENFQIVINDYSEEKAAPTAAILLRYISGFDGETKKLLALADSADKAEKLFYLIAYRESLSVLDRIRDTADTREKERIAFFTARCLESLGDTAGAITAYHSIVTGNPSGSYAKLANRRIYLCGVSRGSDSIRKLARRNSAAVADPAFSAIEAEDQRILSLTDGASGHDMMKEFREIIRSYDAAGADAESRAVQLEKSAEAPAQAEKKQERSAHSGAVKIFTRNGNVFVGTVSEENAKSIVVTTGFGKVRILKADIAKRESAQ